MTSTSREQPVAGGDDARERVDVVVVGAGASGLACAAALQRAGVRVVVLEARGRVGGRIRSLRREPVGTVEVGAQVVHGGAPATWALIEEAGLRTAALELDDDIGVVHGGRRWSAQQLAGVLHPPPWVLEPRLRSRAGLTRSAASALAGLEPTTRQVARAWVEQTWGEDPDFLDLAMMDAVRPGRPPRIAHALVDGYDRLTTVLAGPVDVRLGSPVSRVHWGPGCVDVRGPGVAVRAAAAVLTVPPLLATRLQVTPALPADKVSAASALRSADGLVVLVTVGRPAPRSRWTLLADPPGGMWRRARGSRVLTGHIKGRSAAVARERPWRTSDLGDLLACLAEDGDDVRAVEVVDWGRDEWAGGTYSTPLAGSARAADVWSRPVGGTLFFAGEAAAGPPWSGLVEGALVSGQRAAADVLRRLGAGTV